MIPTPLSPSAPPQQAMLPAADDPSFLWIDQYSEELLLTVQALQQLHAALQDKMVGKFA